MYLVQCILGVPLYFQDEKEKDIISNQRTVPWNSLAGSLTVLFSVLNLTASDENRYRRRGAGGA